MRQGIHDKRTCFEEMVREEGIELEEAAFVGDDVIDLPAMRAGGLAIAVSNARSEVKREAHYVTPHGGGEGALRDALEFILKAQGKWKKILESHIGERSPRGSYQLSAISCQPSPISENQDSMTRNQLHDGRWRDKADNRFG